MKTLFVITLDISAYGHEYYDKTFFFGTREEADKKGEELASDFFDGEEPIPLLENEEFEYRGGDIFVKLSSVAPIGDEFCYSADGYKRIGEFVSTCDANAKAPEKVSGA